MAGINKKIMAFVGTNDAAALVSALAEHTDDIYAAVSDEYGKAPHPGGNITLISKYLDEEKMSSWIDRVGVDIVIDGTDLPASGARAVIKKVCAEKNVEYHRIAAKQQINLHTSIYRNKENLLRDLEYPVGNILVEGEEELYGIITEVKDFSDKVFMMVPADPDIMKRVLDAGYKKENIISINKLIHSDMLVAMFREFEISDYVFPGYLKEGMGERLASVDRSDVKACIYGDLVPDDGMSADDMWDMFAERFGIEEY